ncbi:MAG: hypothetical protein M1835_003969, partial [Candelina submexicana]
NGKIPAYRPSSEYLSSYSHSRSLVLHTEFASPLCTPTCPHIGLPVPAKGSGIYYREISSTGRVASMPKQLPDYAHNHVAPTEKMEGRVP